MNHRLATAAILGLSAIAATAQNTASGYFNDGYMYRHNMNPAISNRQSYFAMPGLGNVNVALRSDIGAGDFVYKHGGQTVSFMHPSVSAEEAVKPFKDNIRLEQDARVDVLSMGFAGKKHRGYTTLGVSVREHLSAGLPGQLFRLAKEGPANQTYDLSALSAHADAFGEVALGHSHKIGENLEIGVKAKLLLGVGNVDITADGTHLTLGDDTWEAVANAEVQASVKSHKYTTTTTMRGPEGQQTPHTYIDGLDFDKPGINGIGGAIDLGAVYNVKSAGLKIGLAVVDLGVIKWNNNMVASTKGPHSVSTDTYIFSADNDDDNSFANEMDRLVEGAATLYELSDLGDQGSRTTNLGATLNASLEYAMPFYDRLTVGLLSTTRLQGDRNWNEERLSINLAPTKWFALSLTGAMGTFGTSYGGMVSLHPKGFSIFAGMDCIGGPYDVNRIPLGRSVQGNVGILFPF